MPNPTALITGASSGIGSALAQQFAADGHDVVLVARRGAPLDALAVEISRGHGVKARVIAADLAEAGAGRRLFDELQSAGVIVDVVVNNAGFGLRGRVAELSVERQLQMIQLNVSALTELTCLFIPGMLQRNRGGVLNVGSTAAFVPGPLMAVYYATKAYVVSFTEALAEEVSGSNVRVSCLAPGATATGFADDGRHDWVAALQARGDAAGRGRANRVRRMEARPGPRRAEARELVERLRAALRAARFRPQDGEAAQHVSTEPHIRAFAIARAAGGTASCAPAEHRCRSRASRENRADRLTDLRRRAPMLNSSPIVAFSPRRIRRAPRRSTRTPAADAGQRRCVRDGVRCERHDAPRGESHAGRRGALHRSRLGRERHRRAMKELVARGVTFEIYKGLPQDERGVCTFPSGAKVAWFKDPDGNTLSMTEFAGSNE